MQNPDEPFLLSGGGCRQDRPEASGKGRGEDHDLLPVDHCDCRDLWPYLWESIPARRGSQFGCGKALAQPSVIDTFLSIIPTNPFESLAKGDIRTVAVFRARLLIRGRLLIGWPLNRICPKKSKSKFAGRLIPPQKSGRRFPHNPRG
jgi:hypothetical protein